MDKQRKSITFYYSKFSLFEDSQKFCFWKYIIFKEKVLENLGEEWKNCSGNILSKNGEYLKFHEIFNACNEIWFNMRKEIKLFGNESLDEFSGNYELFEQEFSKYFKECSKNEAYFKAVLQGYFNTTNQIWMDIINVVNNSNKASKKKLKSENKQLEKMGYLKNKWASIKKKSSESLVIKPLVIVTEKFCDYFQKKQVSEQKEENVLEEQKNFEAFKANFMREACEEIREKLSNLSLKDENALVNLNEKRKLQDYQKENAIQIQKLSKNQEKEILCSDFLHSTSKYIEKFMESSIEKWHVAKCFVSNMIEINCNRLYELESSFSQNIKNNIRVRVLQPAENFYQHLMKIWVIFNSNSSDVELSFNDYLERVKDSMGNTWSEKYLVPTRVFFNTLIAEWNILKEENNNEEQNLIILINKVREDLMKLWEENIINKIQSI